MTLLRDPEVARIIQDFPGITTERKAFLVEYAESLTHAQLMDLLNGDCDPTEIAFIRACVAINQKSL